VIRADSLPTIGEEQHTWEGVAQDPLHRAADDLQHASKEDEDTEERSTATSGATPAHQSTSIRRRRQQKADQGHWCWVTERLPEVTRSRLLRGEVELLEHIEWDSDTVCCANLAESVFTGVCWVEIDLLRVRVGRRRHLGGLLMSEKAKLEVLSLLGFDKTVL
jgi:hypothetical protein